MSFLRWGLPRDPRATQHLTAFMVTGVATVLLTRGGLAAAGYPSVGGSRLHVAHVLWGGLLLAVAVLLQFSFVGPVVRPAAAVLGGIGFGLFIDEVGKFVTRDNDYFFRPAAAIIYGTVIVFILASHLVHGRPLQPAEHLAAAVFQAVSGVAAGLSPYRRTDATGHLRAAGDLRAGPETAALLAALPAGADDLGHRIARTVTGRAHRVLASRPATAVTVALLVLEVIAGVLTAAATLFALVLFPKALVENADQVLATLMSASAMTSAAFILTGLLRLGRDRAAAFAWFQRAILLDLLVTQLLDAVLSQFGTVFGVLVDVAILGVIAAERARLRQPSPLVGHSR
ncbi:hypothetical protein R8Z50_27360 [Longispora sp. K20-0274]|uniref:hypothetical protein n=1 Tax=Longispora sp. K20-0274 TaxID=3088255 RepID=UPI003999843F